MPAHIEERPRFFPGCCLLTNSSQGPFVVSEHLVTQPMGSRFQVRESVFLEIAHDIGYVSSGELADALQENRQLRAELDALRAQLEQIEATHEALELAVDLTLTHGAARHKERIALRKRAPKEPAKPRGQKQVAA